MVFLDTCICVDFLRGKLPSGYQLMRESDPRMFKISTVVEAELLLGAMKSKWPEKNRFTVEQFLLPFEKVPFDSRCACEYASIRAHLEEAGTPIGPNDMMIAATARAHGASVATYNVKEFQRVPGLIVEDWLEAPSWPPVGKR